MEYTTLGSTDVEVSRICLGCMSFGDPDWRPLDPGEEYGHDLVERALELGINFFDTANMYSRGESERVLEEALEGHREEAVVATKVFFQMREDDPNSGGLSRKTVEQELDASLDRLGIDTVDLYQTTAGTTTPQSRRRWPPSTTPSAAGRPATSAPPRCGHQLAEALYRADHLGYERFATMQNHYSLAYREEEREMLPLCAKEDVGVIPWSPPAGGYLACPHEAYETTERGEGHDREELPYTAGWRSDQRARTGGGRRARGVDSPDSAGVVAPQGLGGRAYRRHLLHRTPRSSRGGRRHLAVGFRHRVPRGAVRTGACLGPRVRPSVQVRSARMWSCRLSSSPGSMYWNQTLRTSSERSS